MLPDRPGQRDGQQRGVYNIQRTRQGRCVSECRAAQKRQHDTTHGIEQPFSTVALSREQALLVIDVGSADGDHAKNLRRLPPSRPNGRTFFSMLGAVPAVMVVKDLVLARVSLELHHENRLDP